MIKTKINIDPSAYPREIQDFLEGATVYDSSCSPSAQTLFIQTSAESYFLKTNATGELERESRMSAYLHGHRMAPEVLYYATIQDRDYLVTRTLPGSDGIAAEHMGHPAKLAQVFGESLRVLHSLPMTACPYPRRQYEMVALAQSHIAQGIKDDSLIPEAFDQAAARFQDLRHCVANDVVMHGDYCLPNIILDDWRFSGFVDLGFGGLGDSHQDLYWGLWTLEYNLKTTNYNDMFLDAYGRQEIDSDRLEWNRLLSGFIN